MATDTLTPSFADPSDMTGYVANHVLRFFKTAVEDWSEVSQGLSRWEERHLLDHPTPENLASHAQLLSELEKVAHWLTHVTQSPDFPDRKTTELVAMTIQDLKDRRALWHGKLKPVQREAILHDIFNES
jgi:hypothetical protein